MDRFLLIPFLLVLTAAGPAAATVAGAARAPQSAGDGSVQVRGERRLWHKVTVELAGPFAHELDLDRNPFTDYNFEVIWTHESGAPRYVVPGYFAADGDAANTSASAGHVWRAHLSPDRVGRWNFRVAFHHGPGVAVNGGGAPLAPYDGVTGAFDVAASGKTGRDFRAHGRLEYWGGHYLRFAGSGELFLKAGPDSPETFLAYADFDGTRATKPEAPLKTWQPHVADWRTGDPTWQGGKGKGMIGALNYLASKGLNSFSFIPYNAGGGGNNVWPFVEREAKLRYDCSKLDQWGIVFDHAQTLGLHLHFKLQENEMDDQRLGAARNPAAVPEALDGGKLGVERKLYLRELVARFGHALALNWNVGEENTQTTEEVQAMAGYLREIHYYPSNIVLHTFPHDHDRVYPPLLGARSVLTGASLQVEWFETHVWTRHWVRTSAAAGKPWVVAADEQGHWAFGVPPDEGYAGFDGRAHAERRSYTRHDIRKLVLWGNLMAGGAGVEYYFGYHLPQQDIDAEDWRSRDRTWDDCRRALEFFREHRIPIHTMRNADELVGNSIGGEMRFCFARDGQLYLVYLPYGEPATVDLRGTDGTFDVAWFNPRAGGPLIQGPVTRVRGGDYARIGEAPTDPEQDWLIVVRRLPPE
jgi:hypothetical protein